MDERTSSFLQWNHSGNHGDTSPGWHTTRGADRGRAGGRQAAVRDKAWMGAECRVTIHDEPDAAERNLALDRVLAGEPEDLDEYMRVMRDEQRLIYEFDLQRTYGRF